MGQSRSRHVSNLSDGPVWACVQEDRALLTDAEAALNLKISAGASWESIERLALAHGFKRIESKKVEVFGTSAGTVYVSVFYRGSKDTKEDLAVGQPSSMYLWFRVTKNRKLENYTLFS